MHNIIHLDEIDSTSVWARKHLADIEDFTTVSADIQSAGHGQFERKWFSSNKNGGNLYISLVLKPQNIEHLNELTRYASFKVAKTLEEYGLEPKFKYPNDVLIDGKKISGILAESVFMGNDFKGVVVGMGINLNLNENEVKNIDIPATSVFLETGKNINKNEFLNKLLDNFKNEWEEFLLNGNKGEMICLKKD